MDVPLFPPTTSTNVYQLSLVGILHRNNFPDLANRLVFLCQRDEAEPEEPKYFTREAVFLRKGVKSGSTVVPQTELRVQTRTINSLNQSPSWSLHYQGTLYVRPELTTLVRSVVEVPVSETVEPYLEALDFEYQYEYLMSGARYFGRMDTLDRPIYVHVYEVFVVPERNKLDDAKTNLFDELVVEVSAYANDEEILAVNKELTQFANRLIPIVNLVNLNPTLKKELARQVQARLNELKARGV